MRAVGLVLIILAFFVAWLAIIVFGPEALFIGLKFGFVPLALPSRGAIPATAENTFSLFGDIPCEHEGAPDFFAARMAGSGPSRRFHNSAQVRCWSNRT